MRPQCLARRLARRHLDRKISRQEPSADRGGHGGAVPDVDVIVMNGAAVVDAPPATLPT
jgi:hypothetical protein